MVTDDNPGPGAVPATTQRVPGRRAAGTRTCETGPRGVVTRPSVGRGSVPRVAVPDPVDVRVLAVVAESGKAAVADIAGRLGMDPREVAARLLALSASGLPLMVGVECDPNGIRAAIANSGGWGNYPPNVGPPSGPYPMPPNPYPAQNPGSRPYPAGGSQSGPYPAGNQSGPYPAAGNQSGPYPAAANQSGPYPAAGNQPGPQAAPGNPGQSGPYPAAGSQSGPYSAPNPAQGGSYAPAGNAGGYAAAGQAGPSAQPAPNQGAFAGQAGTSANRGASGGPSGSYRPLVVSLASRRPRRFRLARATPGVRPAAPPGLGATSRRARPPHLRRKSTRARSARRCARKGWKASTSRST